MCLLGKANTSIMKNILPCPWLGAEEQLYFPNEPHPVFNP